jgi:hypothetical protein
MAAWSRPTPVLSHSRLGCNAWFRKPPLTAIRKSLLGLKIVEGARFQGLADVQCTVRKVRSACALLSSQAGLEATQTPSKALHKD